MRASATSGRTSHWRSSRPPIAVVVRSSSSSSDPVASAVDPFDHVQMAEGDRIDQQRIGGDAQR